MRKSPGYHNIQYSNHLGLSLCQQWGGLAGRTANHLTPIAPGFQGYFECALRAVVFRLRPFDAIQQVLQVGNPFGVGQWGSL